MILTSQMQSCTYEWNLLCTAIHTRRTGSWSDTVPRTIIQMKYLVRGVSNVGTKIHFLAERPGCCCCDCSAALLKPGRIADIPAKGACLGRLKDECLADTSPRHYR